ncbi:hypothetical protein Z042_21465 [Chania multitudinisentens RB-25]|uniref:Uncharacterized protein n=1 Tax=Chania multitudinisentens RB-25 TaxID=1441930 RepID=W0LKM1_9GAMM|nr:hypothetical protein Z042_21465 [Chania multitudinisentens RB-25]
MGSEVCGSDAAQALMHTPFNNERYTFFRYHLPAFDTNSNLSKTGNGTNTFTCSGTLNFERHYCNRKYLQKKKLLFQQP